MRLPFFRSNKPKAETPAPTPPRPAQRLISVPQRQTPATLPSPSRSSSTTAAAPVPVSKPVPTVRLVESPNPTPPAHPKGNQSNSNETKVTISAGSILTQLPPQVLTPHAHALLATTKISLPAAKLIPQLITGRITVPLSDLLSLLPSDALRSPLPVTANSQPITLPLAEVVAALPPDALAPANESSYSFDDPELENIPGLFDDKAEEAAVMKASAARKQSAADSISKSEPAPEASVTFTVRAIVDLLPDRVLTHPRAKLWNHCNLDAPVSLSLASILPQLPTGRVRVSLKFLTNALPNQIINTSLPDLAEETVSLPLAQIVSQLTPEMLGVEATQTSVGLDDLDIPDPFQEKSPAPAASTTPPTPVAAKPPVTIEPAISLDADAFNDDSLNIFTEKPAEPVAASAPQATPAPAPESDPVFDENFNIFAETEPVQPTPVTHDQPDAPVALSATPAPEPVETTVEPTTLPAEPASVPKPPVADDVAFAPVSPVETPAEPVVVNTAPEPEVLPEPVTTPEPVVPAAATLPLEEPTSTPAPEASSLCAPATETSAAESTDDEDESFTVPAPEPTAEESDRKFLVNINRCTAEDLQQIPGVGAALARRIVEYRNQNGQFKSIEELRNIPGIGRKTFRALAGVQARQLNRLLGVQHDHELPLQEIVRLTRQMCGVEGCILAMEDGLLLTGELPGDLDSNTVSVFAPQLFKKVGRYVRELRVGNARRITIFTDERPLSIFHAGEVYLIIVHDTRHFSKALLRRCERISEEIARMCRQRATV
jgi:competence ComEA-like helix-hairpin-helix protein